ncbi:MAG: hypothetical protein EOP37_27225 [Rubrivivax sp.]|nr:MAG: hypothetical protein EOP37_27225 [Rubrivivax sp.]
MTARRSGGSRAALSASPGRNGSSSVSTSEVRIDAARRSSPTARSAGIHGGPMAPDGRASSVSKLP